jgi:hypothetical protein
MTLMTLIWAQLQRTNPEDGKAQDTTKDPDVADLITHVLAYQDPLDGVKLEKAARAFRKVFSKPNPEAARTILTALSDSRMPPECLRNIFAISGTYNEYLQSFLVLLSDPDPRIREAAQQAFRDAIRQERGLSEIDYHRTHIFEPYLLALKRDGKQIPIELVDLVYEANPEMALQLFVDCFGGLDALPLEQTAEHRRQIEWLIHVVKVANYRLHRGFLQASDIPLAQKQLSWLLTYYPHWWARRYVVEVLIRDPELANEALLQELRKDKHPYVAKRLAELEKKLRPRNRLGTQPRASVEMKDKFRC